MLPDQLAYENLPSLTAQHSKNRTLSISFLSWFLANFLRLDEFQADDAICDSANDRGIDGIYVDHDRRSVLLFQSKTRQFGAVGDKAIRDFAGSIVPFETPEQITALLAGDASKELKSLIQRERVLEAIANGYTTEGWFVTNSDFDYNGIAYLNTNPKIVGYGQSRIIEEFIDLAKEEFKKGPFSFTIDNKPFSYSVGETEKLYLFVAKATEIITMEGIIDNSLFALNVRLPLGNTKINKEISKSISNLDTHKNFPLFHNGITIVCHHADLQNDSIEIKDYVVVNGAQSIRQLHKNSSKISDDLGVIVRIAQIGNNRELARDISTFSNQQNGIKPKDLRSNDDIQVRIQTEFETLNYKDYRFVVKRGEVAQGLEITSDDAGRELLAFDVKEPWSSHQIYKVFDEKYQEIFSRPAVTAERVIAIHETFLLVSEECRKHIDDAAAHYKLTHYSAMYCFSKICELNVELKGVYANPKLYIKHGSFDDFLSRIKPIISDMVLEIKYQIGSDRSISDYKSDFKSPSKIRALADVCAKEFEKNVIKQRYNDIFPLPKL